MYNSNKKEMLDVFKKNNTVIYRKQPGVTKFPLHVNARMDISSLEINIIQSYTGSHCGKSWNGHTDRSRIFS